jgi:hypothetical protein
MTAGPFGYCFYCVWDGKESSAQAELNAARERLALKAAAVDWIAPGRGILVASVSGSAASELRKFYTHLRRSGWSLVEEEGIAPRGEDQVPRSA